MRPMFVAELENDVFLRFNYTPSCSIVASLDLEHRCKYVRESKDCMSQQLFINYIELLYCTFKPDTWLKTALSLALLLSICVLMFFILAIVTSYFFCPALTVLTKAMGISEHLAGVTILAFGNTAPELFVSLINYRDSPETMVSDMYAGGIYVTVFIGGLICALTPFRLHANNTLRDVCFLLFSIVFVDYVTVSDHRVTVWESIELEREVALHKRQYGVSTLSSKLKVFNRDAGIQIVDRSGKPFNVDIMRLTSFNESVHQNANLLQQFVQSVKPIDMEKFRESGCFMKMLLILGTPVLLILKFLIPIVNFEVECHGWSKLLNSMQITLMPLVVFHGLFGVRDPFGIPSYAFIALITLPVSCMIFLTTRTDISPSGHYFLAAYSVLGSTFVIYACGCEIIHVLTLLSIVTKHSQAILGCSILAWGSNLGDLVANVAMAYNGYQRMSYAACYGGPMLMGILILGFSNLFRAWKAETGFIQVNYGSLGENCIIFLIIHCCSTLLWSMSTNFYARRSIGVFNILVYILFWVYAIFGEVELIQTYSPVNML